MEIIKQSYQILLWIATIFLSISVFACLIRAIMGPRLTDRIVAINVICTKVVILIAILSAIFDNGGLLDIAIVYAMISFLAVVALSKCYLISNPGHSMDSIAESVTDSLPEKDSQNDYT